MIDKILEANKEYSLFSGVKNITVAVSGGADSVALLHALNSIKDDFGFSLTVAHYHHGIRGEEADRDMVFVGRFASSLGLPFVTEKGDAPGYSVKKGVSLETAARDLRYDFLNRVNTGVIATAHNANDNAETVIFNMARGASLNGVCGIPPKRDNIIRPLIFCDRETIEKYCRQNGLPFVTDSTNLLDDCSRNIIRHKVIPVLAEINPACIENVSKMCRNLNKDAAFLDSQAEAEFKKRINNSKLTVKDFSQLPENIAKRIIILFFKHIFGVLPDMYHIERIYDVIIGEISKTSVSRDKSAVCKNGCLFFEDAQKKDRTFSTEINRFTYEDFRKLKNVHDLLSINAVDCDKIIGDVRLIEKSGSDTVKLVGRGVTKTVKQLMTEKKIPLEYRKNLPIIADDGGIVWIYGIGVAERVKTDKSTKVVLYFNSRLL